MRDVHGWDAAVRLRHRPLFDVPIFVAIRPKRYRCPDGAGTPTTTHAGAWYEPRRPTTKAYEPWALRLLIHATVADAARQLSVSAETIEGLLDRGSARTVDGATWERRGVIGIDEIALTRGHRDVVVWVTPPLAGGGVDILALLGDRPQETVAACLRLIPATLRGPSARGHG
jgi:transposase